MYNQYQPDQGLQEEFQKPVLSNANYTQPDTFQSYNPPQYNPYPTFNQSDDPNPIQQSLISNISPPEIKQQTISGPKISDCCKSCFSKDTVETCEKFSFCCFSFVSTITSIVLLCLYFFSSDVSLSDLSKTLSFLSVSVGNPIMNLTLTSGSCPPGYSMITLGEWPGTGSGCSCGGGIPSSGLCSRRSSCRNISGVSSGSFSMWNGYNWCALYAVPNVQYYKIAGQCPSGTMQCYPGLCFVNSVGCPITSLSFNSSQPYNRTIAYGSSGLLYLSSIPGNAPLQTLTAQINGQPCFDPTDIPNGPTQAYPILKDLPNGCSTYGVDDTAFVIQAISEYTVLSQNGFNSAINLPSYANILLNTYENLAGRPRLSLKNTGFCVNIDPDQLGSASSSLGLLATSTLVCSIIGIVFGFISCCLHKVSKLGKSILVVLSMILFIVLFILDSVAYSSLISMSTYFTNLRDQECFNNNQAQSALNDFVLTNSGSVTDIFVFVCILFYGAGGALVVWLLSCLLSWINDY